MESSPIKARNRICRLLQLPRRSRNYSGLSKLPVTIGDKPLIRTLSLYRMSNRNATAQSMQAGDLTKRKKRAARSPVQKKIRISTRGASHRLLVNFVAEIFLYICKSRNGLGPNCVIAMRLPNPPVPGASSWQFALSTRGSLDRSSGFKSR